MKLGVLLEKKRQNPDDKVSLTSLVWWRRTTAQGTSNKFNVIYNHNVGR